MVQARVLDAAREEAGLMATGADRNWDDWDYPESSKSLRYDAYGDKPPLPWHQEHEHVEGSTMYDKETYFARKAAFDDITVYNWTISEEHALRMEWEEGMRAIRAARREEL